MVKSTVLAFENNEQSELAVAKGTVRGGKSQQASICYNTRRKYSCRAKRCQGKFQISHEPKIAS